MDINLHTTSPADQVLLQSFLNGKSDHTLALFGHFVTEYQKLGNVLLHPAKSMIGVGAPDKRISLDNAVRKEFYPCGLPVQAALRG